MSSRIGLSILLLAATTPLFAGTLIEGTDEAGGSHRIMIEGDWARMEYGEDAPPEYLLLNLKIHQAFAVDRVRKRAVDLSDVSGRPAASGKRAANVSFQKKGAGPEIAGYATERYVLRAGKKLCGDHFVAAKTLASDDISRFIVAMRIFSETQTAAQESPVRDACAAAEDAADAEYARLGLPLRVTDEQGKLAHEVRSIRADVKFPAGTFGVPTTYVVTTPRELMEQLKREADAARQPQAPMDDATVKRLREQQMRQHSEDMQRMHPPQAR